MKGKERKVITFKFIYASTLESWILDKRGIDHRKTSTDPHQFLIDIIVEP